MYRRAGVPSFCEETALLVAQPGTGRLLRLEGPARRIWLHLEYPVALADLCDRLSAEYEGDPSTMAREVADALMQLEARGLLEPKCAHPSPATDQRHRYLWLLKRALVNLLYPEHELRLEYLENAATRPETPDHERFLRDVHLHRADRMQALRLAKQDGRPDRSCLRFAHTLVGLFRLDSLERCAERLFADRVEGDFLEAGVCQGGAAIFLRGLQVAHGEGHRSLWAADSFQGLPPCRADADVSAGWDLTEAKQPWLARSLESVVDHFARYDLLDGHVRFLQGWFAETLPHAPIGRLALLRIDADLYQSTMEVLVHLYDKLAPGAFVIVDDYAAFEPCRQAVDEFRASRSIEAPMERADWNSVVWRKP